MDRSPDCEHLPRASIRGYANGSHPIEDSERIVEHLAGCAECRDFFVREMRGAIAHDHPAEVEAPSQPISPANDTLDMVGYCEIRRLGKGGMGTIYSAVQKVTRRRVAIKCITEAGDEPVPAERTLRAMREARALARLDHPHIVSVLDVLRVRGLPALVMEYVTGVPLDAWIQAHRPSPIVAAKIARRVADAVAHAHQRDVLHCDLKPQNVLVEDGIPDGDSDQPSVKLIDFGLAKVRCDDPKITQTGDIVGSPAYMAPEQASGSASGSTPATDIYGIGTILYQLLTGRPPFVTTDRAALIAELLTRPPTRPGAIAGPIPEDLETICLKCLEKDPADRYPDAMSLASDLRAVIVGEPIAGRRPGPWKRGIRWARKNQFLARALAGILLLGTIAASVAAYQIHANRMLIEEALAQSRLRATAEQRAERAEQAVIEELRTGLRELSRQAFGSQPDASSVQASSLQAIAQRWQVFATRLGDDPRSRAIRAEAHLRLGMIHSILGKRDAAVGELGQAEAILTELVTSTPSIESGILLGETYGALAMLAHEQGDDATSIMHFRSALIALNPDPNSPDQKDWVQTQLEARVRIDFGTLLTRRREFDQAKDELTAARELLERAEVPEAYRNELAVQQCRCFNRFAMVEYEQGKVPEAIRTLNQSSARLARLLQSPQSNTEVVDTYVLHQTLLGKSHLNSGQFELAREHLQNAIRTQRQLIETFPSVPLLRSQHAINLSVLSAIETQRGEAQLAIDANIESFEIHQELLDRYPNNIGYRSERVVAMSNLAALYTSVDRLDDANALAPKLLEANRELCRSAPDRIEHQHGLAVALHTVGQLCIRREEPEKAEALLVEAEVIFRNLIDRLPTSRGFQSGLAKVRFGLADLANQKGQWTQAIELYSEAIEIFLGQQTGAGLTDREWVRQGYLRQASVYRAMGNPKEMEACLELASSIGH